MFKRRYKSLYITVALLGCGLSAAAWPRSTAQLPQWIPAIKGDMHSRQSGQLDLSRWQLVGYRSAEGAILEPTSAVLLSFQDGRVAGGTGINVFEGTYTYHPTHGHESDLLPLNIAVSSITEMAGLGEYPVLQALSQAQTYSLLDGFLRLFDRDDNLLLIYAAIPETDLRGTDWLLASYSVDSRDIAYAFPQDAGIVLKFSYEDNVRMILHTECGNYSAPVVLSSMNNSLTVRSFESQSNACELSLEAQNRELLEVLGRTRSFTIIGNQLHLKNADGTTHMKLTARR